MVVRKYMRSLNKPKLSIVIINKTEVDIEKTLSFVSKQRIDTPYEVIVVDASNGKLDYIYKRYAFVKVKPFKSRSRKSITIPDQRNVGIKLAKGSIVVFIDANCKPDQNWLARLTSPIINGGEYITAGLTLSENAGNFHQQHSSSTKKTYLDSAPTINLAIKRSVFNNVGLFDENFNYGSDLDFTRRCVIKGYRILLVPSAQVTHDWGNLYREIRRAYRYGEAKVRLYRKHLEPAKIFFKREYALVIYSSFIILLIPATYLFPYYPLLLLIPLLKNINNDPIRIVISNLVTSVGALKEIAL